VFVLEEQADIVSCQLTIRNGHALFPFGNHFYFYFYFSNPFLNSVIFLLLC